MQSKVYTVVVSEDEDYEVPTTATWFFNGEEVQTPIYTYEKHDTDLLNLMGYNEYHSKIISIQPIEYNSKGDSRTDEIAVQTRHSSKVTSHKVEKVIVTTHKPSPAVFYDSKGNKVNLETKG